jgi:CheY-like chemotaxis protein
MLVADDERVITFALQSFFRGRGFEVDVATDVHAATSLLDQHHYDVVVADLRLAGTSGLEGLEVVSHARQRSSRTAIILLTAYDPADSGSEQANEAGVDVVLQKPKPLSEVERVVRETIAARQQG